MAKTATAKKSKVTTTKKKIKSSPKTENIVTTQEVTKFKIWCLKHNITQRRNKKDTELSIGTIHSTWYKGKANASTIKLISLTYELDESKLKKMIQEFDKSNPIEE